MEEPNKPGWITAGYTKDGQLIQYNWRSQEYRTLNKWIEITNGDERKMAKKLNKKQFIQACEDFEVGFYDKLQKYIKLYARYGGKPDTPHLRYKRTINRSDCISGMFPFYKTPEGIDYWWNKTYEFNKHLSKLDLWKK